MDRLFELRRTPENIQRIIRPLARPLATSLMAGLAFASSGCGQETPQIKEGTVVDKAYRAEGMGNVNTLRGGVYSGPNGYWLLMKNCLNVSIFGIVGIAKCDHWEIEVSEQQYQEAEVGKNIKITPLANTPVPIT